MRFMVSKFALAAIILTTAGLYSHTAKAETILNVPFDFTVAGKAMPAGLYTVEQDTYHNLVILRSKDGAKSFSWILLPGDPAPNEVHVALKFDQSGSARTLRSIQYGPRTTARLDSPRTSEFDAARLSQGR